MVLTMPLSSENSAFWLTIYVGFTVNKRSNSDLSISFPNMRTFTVILFYSMALFAVNYLLIDIEDLVLHQLLTQEYLEISETAILETIEQLKYWNKFSVIFTFLLLTLKAIIIALILYTGLFFEGLHEAFHLAGLFKIAVYAECILVIAGLVKLIVISTGDYSYDFLIHYYPLSLLSLFEYGNVNQLFIYPLQVINLFELCYVFLLIYFLKEEMIISFGKSLRIVVSSYGTAMACWVVFIMFYTLNFS